MSNPTEGSGDNVGGLVGFFEVSASAGSASNTVMMSWSTADVKGVEDFVGGLIGYSNARAGSIVSDDNWAAGNVSGDTRVGGGAGVAGNATFTRNWSSGAVSGEQQSSTGGFVGDVLSDDGVGGNYVSVYWNLDTSGVTRSEGDSVNGSVVVQTLTVSNFGDEAAAAAWDFGDSDISDGVADFPLLTIHSRPWQAVNLARALTRFFGVGDAAAITLMTGTTVTTDGIRLDTNGLAPDDGERAEHRLRVALSLALTMRACCGRTTNYNGVTVDLRLLTGGDEKFVKAATDEKTENCEVGIQSDAVEFAATLRLEISAPAIGDDPAHAARSLTTDYALRITLTESTLPRADPLMIVAPEPQPRVVAANASAGVTILTVSTSGGTNPTFADAENDNLKASGGGDTALVSLTEDAPVAFASDNLTLSLPLTANADGNESATATIRFISAPRAIDNNAAFSKTFSSEAAVANTEVLAGGESGLAIWHFNGNETYTLSGADFASFDVDDGTGEVMIGNSALAADTTYNFDLQLIGGESGAEVTATRAMQVIVDAAPVIDPPDPPSGPIASRAAFVAAIERGDFNWFSAATDMIVIVDGGTSLDWDDDEIENPYDWTPLPGVTLTTGNEDGSAVNPWPIYNVWQLQAIDGVSVSRQRVKSSTDSFFGSGRLSLHYRLAANIDAMPSRDWSGRFDPIASFTGSLDGEGREIRGLHVSTFAAGNSGGAGLFAQIGDGGRVSRLGLPGVEVIAGGGAYRAGAVAATMRGSLSMVWATGTVRGGVFSNGGLAGRLIGGEVRESWFVGIVRGNGSNGGLVGLNGASVPAGNVVNSWAMARVQDDSFAQSNGGLIGRSSGGTLTASWSGGPVDAGTNTGGLIGRPSGGSSILSGGDNYLDASTSEISFAEPQGADYDVDTFVVESMTTLTVRGWDNTVWNFGKIVDTGNPLADPPVPGDNILDYPFLERIDALWPGMQAVAFADFQTNLLLAGAVLPNNGAAILVPGNVILTLDTNGLAANDPDPDDEDDDNRTPAATCENGATEAKTNYNDVTVRLQTTGEGSASFMVGCGINVGYRDDASSYGNFTLSLIIASQNATISDRFYVFGLDSAISSPLPADIAVPADAAAGYEFLTVSLYLGEVINNEGLLPVVNFRFQSASVSVLSQPRQAILSLLEGGAPAMFTRDEQIVHLSLTVSFGGNEEISEIVTLRSEPRGIAPPLPPGTIQLFHAQVGATVLRAGAAGIAIWHTFGASETYSIAQSDSFFGVDTATGLVTVATELSANDPYEFMLQLTDGTVNVTRTFPVMTGDQAAEQATLVVLNFRAPAAGEVVATLGWRPIGGAESYTLSRAEGSETGAYTPIDTSGGELLFGLQNLYLTYTETDLTLGSVYYYKLDSCNDFGCAPTSPILSLSVSSPPPLFDAAPAASPAVELVTLINGASSPAAIFEWDVLLTSRVVEGRYTVVLSVSVNIDSGVSTTIYDEFDATVTLTNALPYDYRLSRSSQGADGGYIEIHEASPSGGVTMLGHFDSDLTLGAVYYYRLSVCNEAGCADPSETLSLTIAFDRLNPPDLSAKRFFGNPNSSSLTVALTWPPVGGADTYRVLRATLANEIDESFVRYADGRVEYRLLKDLDYTQIYKDGGVTVNEAGNPLSDVVVTLTSTITVQKGFVDGVRLISLSFTTTTITVRHELAHFDTVSRDIVYYYQAEACDADDNCGDRSNAVRVGPPPPSPPPAGVSNLAITDFNIVESDTATVAEAVLEWSAVEGANNYRLLRAPIERGIDGEYDVIYESFGLSFTDSNLPLGGAYYYRVRACDASNCGHSSEAVTLRLQRPGRARILFDQSGSSREVKSIGAALAPLSSVTVAWEETPDAQYYYVLRGGELAHHSAATISYPAITVTTTAGTISHTVTLTTPTSTTTLTLTNITEDGTITLGGPIPVLATTYREGLHGDNVRHYWVRACNAFGCGEASEAVVLGGGLLGIGEKDNPRAAGVSVALTLIDASATGNDVVDLTLTALVKAPTGVSASACRADVVTEVVDGKIVGNGGGPRVNFDWDARSGGEAEGRFYRFARSRFADSTSADWIDITAPAAVSRSDNSPLIANGIRTNFAATTFIDNSPFNENDILSNFAATTLYYGVQECAAVRFGTDDARFDVTLTLTNGNVIVTTAYSHESPICSAPVFVEVAPQSSLPQCAGDGVVSAPDKVDVLPDLSGSEIIPIYEVNEQEFVAVDEDGNKITATYAGPEYILAVAAFSVKWDSIPGAAYYRVTRESRDSDGGESSFAAYFVDQGTTEFIERTPFSPGLVNVYWVQACDRQNGCGPLSDPLELAAPPEELDASAVRSPVVVVAPVDSGFVAAIFVVGSPFADRYVLSRAPKPASGEATIYVDLQEEDAPFVRLDEDLESGAEYLYRALVCNAAVCVISEPALIAVGPAGPPTGVSAPRATGEVDGVSPQVRVEWDAVANASAYTLSRSETENGGYAAIYNGAETAYTDNVNVEFDTDYYYRVQACNSFGCAESDAVSASVPAAPVAPPVEPIASRAAFVEAIEKSDFNWFSAATDMIVIVDGGSPSDWDNDEIANPYDWTPLPGVTLTTGDEDGSADNPWPIYNVWQLQAIDGLSVSENGVVDSENFAFFGDGDNLTAHYRLAADIDATPTRNWAGGGFRPIGNVTNINIPTGDFFQGALNGDGYEIRGLSVNFANDHVGLFSGIGGTGSVVSLQLLDLFVRGGSGSTGGLVGFSSGLVSLVGGSGVVEGGSGIRVRVGGLAGWFRNDADIAESWFAGEVKGSPTSNIVGVGGLVGSAAQSQTPTRVNNNWAQSRVTDVNRDSATHVGGLIGVMGSSFQNGWSGGEVFGSSPLGLIGGNLGFPSGGGGYSDRSTSGAENAVSGSAISAQSVETMVTVTQADSGWPNNVWNFGGATDYPFLARYEAMRPGAQAAFYALHQTRLRFGEVEATRGEELELVSGDVFRLDTNGRADDDPTPAPSCVLLGSGEVRAETNYNGVTVLLRSDGAATFSLPDACNVEILFGDEVDAFTLTVVAMAGEATVAAAYSFAGGVFSPLLPTELLSPPAAAAGEAIYTVAIGAGAQLREFTNVSGLSSESGSPEVLKLAMDATVLFATDDAAFDLTLTAMLSGGAVETRVVEVKSDIRLISGEKVELTSNIRLGQGHILLLPESVGLSIWHNGDEPEQYGLIQSGSQDLFTVSATSGTVRVRKEGSLPTRLSEGTYNITIYRSASSPRPLTVMRELQLVVDESAPESNLPIIGPPPSPLMIEAPDDPVVVAADASAGVTILTVSTSGGTNPVFVAAANDNLEASGGGDTALVSLTEDAAIAFASDNLTLSLPLTANADGNESATATIRFVSAPRAINNPITFVKELAYSEAVANAEILASGASGLSLWHHNAGFAYMLVGADSEDFVEDTGGKIAIGNNRLEGDRRYEFRLELRGGVTATLSIQVNVAAEPVVPIASRAAFVEAIEEGDFNWFSAKTEMITIVEGGTTLDWDNDGIENPYDWTPLPGVTLTLGGADGSASKPWPIYNVWQLQAIDGRRVDLDDGTQSGKFTFFGGDSTTRLGAQYRLATDIDATPTRDWGNAGFNPIGGPTGADNVFNGFFDGGGYAVRGLFINRPGGDNIGLFSRIIKSGELAVSNLGVEEANISGRTNVGIFAGLAEASFSGVWTTGNVKSNEAATETMSAAWLASLRSAHQPEAPPIL